MKTRLHMVRNGALAGVLLGAVVGFAGCGSSSSGGGPVAGGTRVTGTASAPSAQVARAAGLDLTAIARAVSIGSPAEAGPSIARRRVRNAVVEAALLHRTTPVATTTTDSNGNFVITISGLPHGTPVVITVRGQGANGPIHLAAILKAGISATVDVNEATTVGAEAGEIAAGEGASDDAVVEAADGAADAHEADEAQDPAQVPDLADNEQARQKIREHAHQHLVGNFGVKVRPAMGMQPPHNQAWQAIMAAQVYAHRVLGLPVAVHLSREQATALVELIAAGKQFTAAEVATALGTAGVKSGETAVSEDDVKAALTALKARPVLITALADVTDAQIPALVALLVAEQANDDTVAFKVTTQDQLNAYVNALVGKEVAGPVPPAEGSAPAA